MPIIGQPPTKQDKELAKDLSGTLDTNQTFDEHLLNKKFTQDTFHNRTALNTSRLDPIIKKLQNYSSGSPIMVTWYSQINNKGNKQSHVSDYSAILSNVHKAYDKIMDFPIRLNGEFSISVDEETQETTVEGTGKIVAGFLPAVGNIFLYEIYPGQIGLFLVSNVTPLGLHREAAYETSFILKEYVTNETLLKLQECVIDTYYFTTQKQLGESTALLTRTDYYDLQKILNLRNEMINYFIEIFYDSNYQSVKRDDNVYDPYIVNFFNKIVSFEECPNYPLKQLVSEQEYSRQSILDDFIEGIKLFNPHKITKYVISTKRFTILSAITNSLNGRQSVFLDAEYGELFYMFSELFYNKDINNPDLIPYEKFILTYFNTKIIPIPELLTYIEELPSLPKTDQFYRIPILIYFCNIIISNI